MIRVMLPAHLRTLAHVDGEVKLDVEGHPLAGRSRGKDLSCRKNFILSLFFLLAEFVIFR